jgi:hypothetical protein
MPWKTPRNRLISGIIKMGYKFICYTNRSHNLLRFRLVNKINLNIIL